MGIDIFVFPQKQILDPQVGYPLVSKEFIDSAHVFCNSQNCQRISVSAQPSFPSFQSEVSLSPSK